MCAHDTRPRKLLRSLAAFGAEGQPKTLAAGSLSREEVEKDSKRLVHFLHIFFFRPLHRRT